MGNARRNYKQKPEIFYILFHSLCIITLENKHNFLIQIAAEARVIFETQILLNSCEVL